MAEMDYNGYRESLEAEWIAKEIAESGSLANVALTAVRDTGWRNLASLSVDGAIPKIRRIGNLVHFKVHGWVPTTTVTQNLLPAGVPDGFKPDTSAYVPAYFSSSVTLRFRVLATVASAVEIAPVQNISSQINAEIIYMTNDVWPATLPGITA